MNDQEKFELGIVYLQFHDRILRIPFARFQTLAEKVLKRPIWTHEFADTESMKKEVEVIWERAVKEEKLIHEINTMLRCDDD